MRNRLLRNVAAMAVPFFMPGAFKILGFRRMVSMERKAGAKAKRRLTITRSAMQPA